jgi:hypothetical protein
MIKMAVADDVTNLHIWVHRALLVRWAWLVILVLEVCPVCLVAKVKKVNPHKDLSRQVKDRRENPVWTEFADRLATLDRRV